MHESVYTICDHEQGWNLECARGKSHGLPLERIRRWSHDLFLVNQLVLSFSCKSFKDSRCMLKPGSHMFAPIVSVASIVCKYWARDDRRRSKWLKVIGGSHMIVPIAWYERSPTTNNHFSPRSHTMAAFNELKEQNSWPPIFSFMHCCFTAKKGNFKPT